MRRGTRGILAAVTAVAAVLALTSSAQADKDKPVPTQAQVDAAQAEADRKAGDVSALQAQLAVANGRLQAAAERAEMAAEAYNGAVWRLGEAKKKTEEAKAAAAAALAEVEARRSGIAQLVAQSYQDGTALSGVTAFLADEGPEGIMNRWGVVQSAGASMKAQYDEFTAVSALAEVAEEKAAKAQKEQASLTRKAAELRDIAAAAANEAQSEAARIAGQRRQLIAELAAAQEISVELATRRQKALEEIAQEKAAAAAAAEAKKKAKEEAEKAKNDAEKAKDEADATQDELANLPEEGGWDDPGLPIPAGTSEGATKAIRFARAQLGEPYLWGAAGPDAWDCSGLTMMAWRQGGVSLPHYSAAQYQQTKHLSVGNLKAGDLVFWGTSPNTIHHVAMYIGSGQIIHAPRTGQPVQINSMYYWEPPNYFGRP